MDLTPYLVVTNAPEALAFYTKAFGAAEAHLRQGTVDWEERARLAAYRTQVRPG